MDLLTATTLAQDLMMQHGLTPLGWRPAWFRSARCFGRCSYYSKQIMLSKPLVELNGIEEVRNTILHEIAHALTKGAGHGPAWKAMCVRIGARPERCYKAERVVQPKMAWTSKCPACNWSRQAQRPSRRVSSCPACSGGRFNPSFMLVWTRNEELPPAGPSSSINTDLAKVLALREQGLGWAAIEKALGWPDTHGNRPWRMAKAYRR